MPFSAQVSSRTLPGLVFAVSPGGAHAYAQRAVELPAEGPAGNTPVRHDLIRVEIASGEVDGEWPARALPATRLPWPQQGRLSPDGDAPILSRDECSERPPSLWVLRGLEDADPAGPLRVWRADSAWRWVAAAAWSPDGGALLFVTASQHLYVWVGGGPPIRVATGVRGSEVPLWSPDGERIAFREAFGGTFCA